MKTITKYILDGADLKQAIIGYLRDEEGGSPGTVLTMKLKDGDREFPQSAWADITIEVECEE